jgi:hypothetical protein
LRHDALHVGAVSEVLEEKLKKTSAIIQALQDQCSSAEGILQQNFAFLAARAMSPARTRANLATAAWIQSDKAD